MEIEDDGRWIAEIPEPPGVMAHGSTRKQAIAKADALALRVMADRLEREEEIPERMESINRLMTQRSNYGINRTAQASGDRCL
jgi:predicted RNase H-like HicB family nuclease